VAANPGAIRLSDYVNDNTVAGALGEAPKVPFLALARLVVRADTAVDGDLSQLNPSEIYPWRH